MTIPSEAVSHPAIAPPRESRSTRARIGRYVTGKAWVHALLAIGVAVCVYPLIWMFLMSIKTDEEIGQESVAPSVPVFRDRSPYVRAAPETNRPIDVDPARFAAALPALRDLTTAAATAALPADPPPSVA